MFDAVLILEGAFNSEGGGFYYGGIYTMRIPAVFRFQNK